MLREWRKRSGWSSEGGIKKLKMEGMDRDREQRVRRV
jgi:hypothetical protein